MIIKTILFLALICNSCGPIPEATPRYEDNIIFETATSWYVDNAASGANNGTSWTDAWESFSDIAWASVAGNDNIYISGGSSSKTYNETLTIGKSGTDLSNRIYINVGANSPSPTGHNGTVIIDGGGTRATGIDNSGGYDNIIVWGMDNSDGGLDLQIQNTVTNTDGAVNVANSSYFYVGGVKIINANDRGILWENVDHGVIELCDISTGTSSTDDEVDGLYIKNGNDNLITRNRVVISNTGTGANEAVQIYKEPDIIIGNNYFAHASGYGNASSTTVYLLNATGAVYFYNNVVVGPNLATNAIRLTPDTNGVYYLMNNTIISTYENTILLRMNVVTDAGLGLIQNNIFYSLGGVAMRNDSAWEYTGSKINGNNIYKTAGTSVSYFNSTTRTFAQHQAAGYDLDGRDGDPGFDASNEYRLFSTSDNIGAGLVLSSYFTTDRDGDARGAAWDIGADEYVPGGATATPTTTATATQTFTPSPSNTPTETPDVTATPTVTPTITLTPTQTPTVDPSITKWYVDNAATGANNGTSWTDAWESFADIVWASVDAGDTIYISGGSTTKTYNETLTVGKSGTSTSAMINITAGANSTAPSGHDGTVIINGGGSRTSGISVSGRSYVHVNGLNGSTRKIKVQGQTSANVYIANVSYVYVDYVEIVNATSRGVFEEDSDHVRLKGNYIYTGVSTANVQTDGIYMQVGYDNTVEDNVVILSTENASQHMDCFQTVQEHRLTVRGNWFEWEANKGNFYSQAIISEDFADWQRYYNNVVIGNTMNPLSFYLKEADPGGVGYVWNNIAFGRYSGSNASAFCSKLTNDETGEIKNNIFVSTVSSNVPMRLTQSGLTASKVDYNLLYAAGTYVAEITGSNRTWSQYVALGFDAHGINDDPDLDSGDAYRLLSTSPAIDAGTSFSGYFTTDRDGVSRPQGAAWDMGAYEYESGSTPSTSTPTSTTVPANTPTSTPTGTYVPPTSTPTATATRTPVPTSPPTNTPTNTPTRTPMPTNTPTTGPGATSTPTRTPVPMYVSGLVFNEVSPTNIYDWNLDGDITYADRWVELYNAGASTIDLAEYRLSDGTLTGTLRGWGVTILPIGGRRVLFGEDLLLIPASGTLTLYNALVTPVATVTYSAQTAGLCYARVPSGSTTWLNNQVCTPGQ